MDIYSLLNSKAISEHCRKIAHQFTPLEMAYIISANEKLNIPEKHAAITELIETQPDMEVLERNWTPHFDSLHDFLRKYMELQNKYLAIFYQDEPNCIYSYEVWFKGDNDYSEDGRLFSSFTPCFKAMQSDVDDLVESYKQHDIDVSPIDIRIKKQWINNADDENPKYITVCIDYNNNPTEIWQDCVVISSEDNEILEAFFGLWLEIPTPFQKGDILIERRKHLVKEEPFVLDWLPYWNEDGQYTKAIDFMRESGDGSDMTTSIYGQDPDGAIWRDHGPCYLDMEYCEKELEGTEKILIAVSNHIKGELDLELLVRSYDILRNESHAKSERYLLSGFIDEVHVKAGLKEKIEDANGERGYIYTPDV